MRSLVLQEQPGAWPGRHLVFFKNIRWLAIVVALRPYLLYLNILRPNSVEAVGVLSLQMNNFSQCREKASYRKVERER